EITRSIGRSRLMIADGHHRYAVALAYRQEMRAAVGPGPWDAMMMLVVDAQAEDPPVLPIHRTVSPGTPVPPPSGDRVRDMAEILASVRDEGLSFGTVRLEDGAVTHRVASLGGLPPTVCALHDQILDRIDPTAL